MMPGIHRVVPLPDGQFQVGGRASRRPAPRPRLPQSRGNVAAQPRYRLRQLVAAAGCLAEPERDRRRHATRIFHAHDASLDPNDAIGAVAELENVAGHALDGEVFVDRTDRLIFGFQHNLIVGRVGNCSAGGRSGQAGAPAFAQLVIDRVMVQQCAAPASACAETLGQNAHHGGKFLALQGAVRPGAAA